MHTGLQNLVGIDWYARSNCMNISRRTKIISIVFFSILVFFVSYSIVLDLKYTTVKIIPLPSDSLVTIDGVKNQAETVKLKSGIHKLVATRQYFDKAEKIIDVKNIKDGETIYMLPEPNSTEAKKWLSENPEVQIQREAAGGAESNTQQKFLSEEFPVTNKLPIENSFYRIDYSMNQNNKVEFTVNLFGVVNGPNDYDRYKKQLIKSKANANQFLEDNGVKLGEIKVTYIPNI